MIQIRFIEKNDNNYTGSHTHQFSPFFNPYIYDGIFNVRKKEVKKKNEQENENKIRSIKIDLYKVTVKIIEFFIYFQRFGQQCRIYIDVIFRFSIAKL